MSTSERVVSVDDCLRLSEEAARRALALKQAIRSGRATELELDIDPALLEA